MTAQTSSGPTMTAADHRTSFVARDACQFCGEKFAESAATSVAAVIAVRRTRDAHEALHRGPELFGVSHRFGGPT